MFLQFKTPWGTHGTGGMVYRHAHAAYMALNVLIGSRVHAFDWYQNQPYDLVCLLVCRVKWLELTLNGVMRSVTLHNTYIAYKATTFIP